MAGKKYTDQQKEEFFRLLDRGGTVRDAARAVGVHENAGYNWLRKTWLTMARAAPRTYPAELKAEFLRLVREREIISTVAHELGFIGQQPMHGRGKQEYRPARHARSTRGVKSSYVYERRDSRA